MTQLVNEFYSSLPHRAQYTSIPTSTEMRSWLSKKQDICQVKKFNPILIDSIFHNIEVLPWS